MCDFGAWRGDDGDRAEVIRCAISALDVETSAIARSYGRYRRGVLGDIGNSGVGVTPQMCNRVTNHGDIHTFSRPGRVQV